MADRKKITTSGPTSSTETLEWIEEGRRRSEPSIAERRPAPESESEEEEASRSDKSKHTFGSMLRRTFMGDESSSPSESEKSKTKKKKKKKPASDTEESEEEERPGSRKPSKERVVPPLELEAIPPAGLLIAAAPSEGELTPGRPFVRTEEEEEQVDFQPGGPPAEAEAAPPTSPTALLPPSPPPAVPTAPASEPVKRYVSKEPHAHTVLQESFIPEPVPSEPSLTMPKVVLARTSLILPMIAVMTDDSETLASPIARFNQYLARKYVNRKGEKVSLWKDLRHLPPEVGELSKHFRQLLGWREKSKRQISTWKCYRMKLGKQPLHELFSNATLWSFSLEGEPVAFSCAR
jgi:hypothetical protein